MADWINPTDGSIFLTGLAVFLIGGLLYYAFYERVIVGYGQGPVFGRAIFGAGLFYFFFSLLFVVAYGAAHADVLYDETGSLQRGAVRDDFSLGLFVAVKDVGTPLGVALGFLSLAWGRFLDLSIKARDEEREGASVAKLSSKIDELAKVIERQRTGDGPS